MEKITAERVLAELAEIAFADLGAEPAPPVKVGDKLRALELIYISIWALAMALQRRSPL